MERACNVGAPKLGAQLGSAPFPFPHQSPGQVPIPQATSTGSRFCLRACRAARAWCMDEWGLGTLRWPWVWWDVARAAREDFTRPLASCGSLCGVPRPQRRHPSRPRWSLQGRHVVIFTAQISVLIKGGGRRGWEEEGGAGLSDNVINRVCLPGNGGGGWRPRADRCARGNMGPWWQWRGHWEGWMGCNSPGLGLGDSGIQ